MAAVITAAAPFKAIGSITDDLNEQFYGAAIAKKIAMQPDDVAETCADLALGAGRI